MNKTLGMVLGAAALLLGACAATPPPPPPAAVLENTPWRLTVLDGRAALDGPSLQLEQAQIQARGNAGCNNFFGRYEIDGERLRFGPLAATRRACGSEMDGQEIAFLKALGETRAWRIAGDTLVLRGEAGAELARFVVQPRKQ